MSDLSDSKRYALAAGLPTDFSGPRAFGNSRSVLCPGQYLLHVGEARVFGRAPSGWTGRARATSLMGAGHGAYFAMRVVRASPGATFVRLAEADGSDRPPALFLYVLSGALAVIANGVSGELGPGCFAYAGALGASLRARVEEEGTAVLVVEKEFPKHALRTFGDVVVGDEDAVPPEEVFGETCEVRKLLARREANAGFNIHIMDLKPGQHLNAQEVHMKQHGVVLLRGKGICMLNQRYFPVSTGKLFPPLFYEKSLPDRLTFCGTIYGL